MPAPIALDAAKIHETLEQLCRRIEERFPGSGLARLGTQILELARASVRRVEFIRAPKPLLRATSALLLAAMGALLWFAIVHARPPPGTVDALDMVQAIEATLSALTLLGVSVLFVTTLESRIRRRKALDALQELRVLAHVVDMHQLAKDPERTQAGFVSTSASPRVLLTPFELNRYLHYCTDLLALVGKIAAFYVASFQDEVVLAAVNEIEDLTNGLSRKIWQKLMLLDQITADEARTPGAPRSIETDAP